MRSSKSITPAPRFSAKSSNACAPAGVDVAFARLESVRAQQSFARQGLEALVGRDHLFHSVEEAVRALTPGTPQ